MLFGSPNHRPAAACVPAAPHLLYEVPVTPLYRVEARRRMTSNRQKIRNKCQRCNVWAHFVRGTRWCHWFSPARPGTMLGRCDDSVTIFDFSQVKRQVTWLRRVLLRMRTWKMRLANVAASPCFAETATYVCSSRVCFRIQRAGLASRVLSFLLPVTAGPLLSCTTGSFCKGGVRLEALLLLLEEL